MSCLTVTLIIQVLRAQEETDDFIHTIADALERFESSGEYDDEEAVQKAAKAYLKVRGVEA